MDEPGQSTVRPSICKIHGGARGLGRECPAFAERLTVQACPGLPEHAAEDDIRRARPASLAEVLAADIVSWHRGLTNSTRHTWAPELAETAQARCSSTLHAER